MSKSMFGKYLHQDSSKWLKHIKITPEENESSLISAVKDLDFDGSPQLWVVIDPSRPKIVKTVAEGLEE